MGKRFGCLGKVLEFFVSKSVGTLVVRPDTDCNRTYLQITYLARFLRVLS